MEITWEGLYILFKIQQQNSDINIFKGIKISKEIKDGLKTFQKIHPDLLSYLDDMKWVDPRYEFECNFLAYLFWINICINKCEKADSIFYTLIKNLTSECPLCEYNECYNDGDETCSKCPLDGCGDGSMYDLWECETNSPKYSKQIYKTIEKHLLEMIK